MMHARLMDDNGLLYGTCVVNDILGYKMYEWTWDAGSKTSRWVPSGTKRCLGPVRTS